MLIIEGSWELFYLISVTHDFQINMGDKVAQLIFEKIKTPVLKEVDSLEDTDRGNKGFGSTEIKTILRIRVSSISDQDQ